VFAVIGMTAAGRGFWTEFSAALGFVGLSLLGVEFALVARVRSVAAPFGTDALVQCHRQIGLVGLGLVVVHVAISADVRLVARFYDPATAWRVRFGLLALVALILLIASSGVAAASSAFLRCMARIARGPGGDRRCRRASPHLPGQLLPQLAVEESPVAS